MPEDLPSTLGGGDTVIVQVFISPISGLLLHLLSWDCTSTHTDAEQKGQLTGNHPCHASVQSWQLRRGRKTAKTVSEGKTGLREGLSESGYWLCYSLAGCVFPPSSMRLIIGGYCALLGFCGHKGGYQHSHPC